MDDPETHLLCLMDVCERIIDEETLTGGFSNAFEQDLKDLGARLYMTDFA